MSMAEHAGHDTAPDGDFVVRDPVGHLPGPSGMSRDNLRSGGVPIEFHGVAAADRASLTGYGRSVTSRAVASRKRAFRQCNRNDSIGVAQPLARQIELLVKALGELSLDQRPGVAG